MTINTPPQDPSRQTIQSKAVATVKTEVSRLYNWFHNYAGHDKPAPIEASVKQTMKDLNEWLPKVVRARSMGSGVLEQWTKLWDTYAQGTGSWTKCLPLAQKLNDTFKDVEP